MTNPKSECLLLIIYFLVIIVVRTKGKNGPAEFLPSFSTFMGVVVLGCGGGTSWCVTSQV